MVMQWYLWRVRTVMSSIFCESGCAGTSHTCHACGKTWNSETPVVANPLAVFKPKLHGLKLEIESRAPGRQAGGPAVLASLAIEPEWLA